MAGFFGTISTTCCVNDLFYGTDYHSHLGTKRAGMAFYDGEKFVRSIHSLENGYFRNKFEDDLPRFGESKMGIGVISDCESQPITITSHLGRYAVASVARIDNIEELTKELLEERHHFAELSDSKINASELVAILIGLGKNIQDGINIVHSKIKGSCSMLILTDHAIYAARDKFGRTPITIGKNDKGYVCASESEIGYPEDRNLDGYTCVGCVYILAIALQRQSGVFCINEHWFVRSISERKTARELACVPHLCRGAVAEMVLASHFRCSLRAKQMYARLERLEFHSVAFDLLVLGERLRPKPDYPVGRVGRYTAHYELVFV